VAVIETVFVAEVNSDFGSRRFTYGRNKGSSSGIVEIEMVAVMLTVAVAVIR
jgi:hypothetical protein